MLATTSAATSRPAPPRSLPTLTVFSHPAARLVKTVPQLQPPARINGHVPIDTLGVGRTSSSDIVLTDVYGPLSILVVPDPLDPTIATLVLSVGFQDTSLQGAARRFILPFRSFQRDPVSGQLISQSQIKGFDAADRAIYPGLGAGLKGLDGGSFWFYEDVGEEGAFDRYRWHKDGVGRRAIWTVWLISTPAPVVLHVQSLLQSYPAPVSPLPPWLKQDNGYPWKDSYLALAPAANELTCLRNETALPTAIDNHSELSAPSTAPLSPRPLPSIPPLPAKPDHHHIDHAELSKKELAAAVQQAAVAAHIPDAADTARGSQVEATEHNADTTPGMVQSRETTPTKSRLSVRSRHLRDGSSSVTIGDTPEVILREMGRPSAMPEYRNSLVAVDNVTGQIIGVLASQINLDSPPSELAQLKEAPVGSSDEADADLDEEEEAQTPLDEHVRILQNKAPGPALGLQADPNSLFDESVLVRGQEDLVTPRQSGFVHRPTSVYRDADATRAPSRPPSILAQNTFAPPPLPPKQPELRRGRGGADTVTNPVSSRPTSAASAAFFSAESDADATSSYDSDALEIDARSITRDNLPPSFVSIRGKTANNVERHRPELLQDHQVDEDAASDASGSTVGGPAIRMWRKARGKTKRKSGTKAAKPTDSAARVRQDCIHRQASEVSDRTSKAETALEGLSDIEIAHEADADEQSALESKRVDQSDQVSVHQDQISPLTKSKLGPGHHLPRAALRTDEVRSIEDRVWREALDDGQLPIDAPYTHLAARGDAGFYPSSILSSPRFLADDSAIELLSAEDKSREAERKKKKQQQQRQRADRIKNMQGGTVLIEFLAGSSRIGASLIRSAGLDASSGDGHVAADQGSSAQSDTALSVFGYVPLLPQHLLSFFGLSLGSVPSKSGADASCREASAVTPVNAYLPTLRLPVLGGLLSDASDWVTSLFSFNSSTTSDATQIPPAVTDADVLGDPSKAEEWEYAIPEFDPNSLSSTPRPVYRRKRPVPSAMNGFNINNAAPSNRDNTDSKREPPVLQQRSSAGSVAVNEQRYSILHIDSLGVGRRAFLRGMPELEGLRL